MLFHEPTFLFVFLPLTLVGYLLLRRFARQETVVIALGSASLVFYGWWDSRYLALIVGSVLFNFVLGRQVQLRKTAGRPSSFLLAVGVTLNLGLLFLFKYLAFAIDTVNGLLPSPLPSYAVGLPLGISFFTFLQIAYLVDCHRGETRKTGFAPYFLFVTFFPHLIAGPLIHHSEMIPQFGRRAANVWRDLAVGLTVFAVGLFKKLVLAQQMAYWADSVFDGAATGIAPTLMEGWIGAFCFAFQIYFDFSGYSDMAIGLSRMFGIRMPTNFASPYKSRDIIEFWRRWHMTLSRFFREYLYIPLGGNRTGPVRQLGNLFLVMLLAGLWHGASWKFAIWGALHGVFLVICHGWIQLRRRSGREAPLLPTAVGMSLTFIAVVAAWVPFRADSLATARVVMEGMLGLNGVTLPSHYARLLGGAMGRLADFGVAFGAMTSYGGGWQLAWLLGCQGFVLLLPNTQELMRHYRPALVILGEDYRARGLPSWLAWRPGWPAALAGGLPSAYLCFLAIQGNPGEFIYFRF